MADLKIHRVDEGIVRKLAERAEEHGRSVEEEARSILSDAVRDDEDGNVASEAEKPPMNLGVAILETFRELGGVELDIPVRNRTSMRQGPA